MAYNLSLVNGSGVVQFVQTVNDQLMFGWYGKLTLITLFIIFYIGFLKTTNNSKKAFGMSALFVALFSVMFRTMRLIADSDLLIAWIIAAIVMALSFLTPDD